jgi:hypothetical protein
LKNVEQLYHLVVDEVLDGHLYDVDIVLAIPSDSFHVLGAINLLKYFLRNFILSQ